MKIYIVRYLNFEDRDNQAEDAFYYTSLAKAIDAANALMKDGAEWRCIHSSGNMPDCWVGGKNGRSLLGIIEAYANLTITVDNLSHNYVNNIHNIVNELRNKEK